MAVLVGGAVVRGIFADGQLPFSKLRNRPGGGRVSVVGRDVGASGDGDPSSSSSAWPIEVAADDIPDESVGAARTLELSPSLMSTAGVDTAAFRSSTMEGITVPVGSGSVAVANGRGGGLGGTDPGGKGVVVRRTGRTGTGILLALQRDSKRCTQFRASSELAWSSHGHNHSHMATPSGTQRFQSIRRRKRRSSALSSLSGTPPTAAKWLLGRSSSSRAFAATNVEEIKRRWAVRLRNCRSSGQDWTAL